jgi:hypothetical protein
LAIGSTLPPRAEEDLVGVGELGGGQASDAERDRERLAELDHGAARDALEDAARGGSHRAVAHREDVEARPLGDVAGRIDDAARVCTTVVGVEHRLHEVEPVVVLDRRIDRLGRDADAPADVQVDAGSLLLGRRDPDERHGVGVEAVGRQARVARARRRHAARADHRDVGIAQATGAHAAMQDLVHLGTRVRNRHAQLGDAGEEAVEVVLEAEERALPDAGDVVGRVRTRESPVEQRDLGFRQRLPVAVDEDRSALELARPHRSHRRLSSSVRAPVLPLAPPHCDRSHRPAGPSRPR